MLTRQAIDSGEYLDHFESLPNLWSTERIERSLAETIKSKPAQTRDIWIFAYGSLMWNPLVHFDDRQVATLHGWHRSFCLHMHIGRGSPEMPGRMLALEAGGHTHAVALKLASPTMAEELRLVWIREMVLGSYRPLWVPITLRCCGRETVPMTGPRSCAVAAPQWIGNSTFAPGAGWEVIRI